MNFKNVFTEVNEISDSIRFDKCRVERPYEVKDPITGEISQEGRNIIGEYKCALYENVGVGSVTIETDIDRAPEKVFKIHLKKGIDIQAGDYIFIYKNFFLDEINEVQEYTADFPINLKTHLEVSLIPNMEV
jgi:hypothetical protein